MDSMILLVAVVGVVVGAVLVVVATRRRRPAPPGKAEEVLCEPRRELFSVAERSFLGVLEQALEGEFRVFGKVQLADLIQPAGVLAESRKASLRDRLQQKHVDFVLCRPDTFNVAAVVELDDTPPSRREAPGAIRLSTRRSPRPGCRCCASRHTRGMCWPRSGRRWSRPWG